MIDLRTVRTNFRNRAALLSITLGAGLALLSAATHSSHAAENPPYYAYGTLLRGTVTKVSDGDTIHFVIDSEYGKIKYPMTEWQNGTMPKPVASSNAGKKLKVRMVAIDTAELHLPAAGGMYSQGYWAEEAQRELERTIPEGTKVDLHVFGSDSHGRSLGRVYLNHEDVNLHMVETGLAVTYTICEGLTCRPGFFEEQLLKSYEDACEDAVNAQDGIFSPVSGLEELPFEFRLRIQNRVPEKYVGNRSTMQLYSPEDYQKVPVCQRVFFPVLKDAEKMGFKRISEKK